MFCLRTIGATRNLRISLRWTWSESYVDASLDVVGECTKGGGVFLQAINVVDVNVAVEGARA